MSEDNKDAPETKRVVVYARVSTDDPRQAGSCDNQIARCKDYCRAFQYEVVAVIKEEGVSAKTMDRPGWRQVEELLLADAADIVLSTALDRMTRTVEGFLRCVREVFDPSDKRFIVIHENIDTSNALGRMAFHMLLALSEFMRAHTAEKVSATRQLKAKQGLHSTVPPFGTIPGEVRGIPEKDPERWHWLEKIFEMAAEGVPDSQIIAELDANGVTTVRGAKVGKTTLPNLIANRFYLGEVHNDGVWYPAKHKCLIDPDLWQRAQRDRQAKRGPKPKDYIYLLDGLLVTSHYRLTYPENRKGQACPFFTKYNMNRHGTIYFNYARGDRIDRHGGIEVEPTDDLATDLPVYINAEDLDNKIVEWLLDEANKGALAAAIQQARQEARDRGSDVEADIKQLSRQITEAAKKRDSLKRKVVELVQDDQMAAVRAVNDELEAADQQLELLNSRCQGLEAAVARLADAETEMDAIDDNVTLIRRGWEEGNREAIRALLRSIIQEIDIRMDGIVIKVYALPGMRVYEKGRKAAPTGVEPVTPP